MSDNYKQDLEIDFSTLDTNWRDHSIHYMEWAEKWAQAVSQRDHAKESLEVMKATLDAEIREEFIGPKKLTESAIAAKIVLAPHYQKAQKILINANETVNHLQSAKSAFEARKKALEGLTNLWLGGYFSTPNVPREVREEAYKKMEERVFNNQKTQAQSSKRRLLVTKQNNS